MLAALPKDTRQTVEAVLDFCGKLREGQEPWIHKFGTLSLPCFTIEREEDLSSLSKLIHFL